MIAESVKFRGHGCFKNEWVGFDAIKPVNVIIGRNNTGKSHLLDFVSALCSNILCQTSRHLKCKGKFDEQSLKLHFREGVSGGHLGGYHWDNHGRLFVGTEVYWEANVATIHCNPVFPDGYQLPPSPNNIITQARISLLREVLKGARHYLSGKIFRRLLADRDIHSEPAGNQLALEADGAGATNLIRRYILSSNPKLSRDLIQVEFLAALNQIFKTDGEFTEIQVKQHDERGADTLGFVDNNWEVYLGEKKKGLIALSRSGSGLKTVILVLLNLLVLPRIPDTREKQKSEYVFAFEELENNLHPALLRRLFQYLEDYAVREQATIFLTTHSSVALDIFGLSKNAQIIHVTHNGESAKAETVSAHFDHLGVISELGAKPSDLLQANGIIWVEGPSDCIYLNRWIDLVSAGKLHEGRDYLCAFYGGSLLARTQFASPEEAEAELVNLFRVNPNIVVVCDGDRASKGARVKDRVRRIRAEVLKIPNAHIWVTGAREIENYIPGNVLAGALEHASPPDPEQYELFFPKKGHPGTSYIERRLNRKTLDKMDLAVLCAPKMEKAIMAGRFDWEAQIKNIVEKIQGWNL
jgi:putative ATP-dependent endonuclease of OLD family